MDDWFDVFAAFVVIAILSLLGVLFFDLVEEGQKKELPVSCPSGIEINAVVTNMTDIIVTNKIAVVSTNIITPMMRDLVIKGEGYYSNNVNGNPVFFRKEKVKLEKEE